MKLWSSKHLKLKLFSLGVVGAGVLTLPLILAANCAEATTTSQRIKFDGKIFNSISELTSYARSIQEIVPEAQSTPQWLVNDGIRNRVFDSPREVHDYAATHFTEVPSYIDQSFYDNLDGGRVLNFSPTSNADDIVRVYQGPNDSIYFDDASAQDAYLQEHQAYYFNNMYFLNQADLVSYLRSDKFDFSQLVTTGRVVKALRSNGAISISDVLPNSYNEAFNSSFSDFVKDNVENTYRGAPGKALEDLTASDVNLEDIPYLKLENSGGRGSYIVDLKSSVEGSLIGPYILTGSADPTSTINDRNQWAISNIDYASTNYDASIEEIALDTVINIALSTLSEKNSSQQDTIFTEILVGDLSHDQRFIAKQEDLGDGSSNNGSSLRDELEKLQVSVHGELKQVSLLAALKQIEINLSNGKSYGFFKAIPALRSWLINQIVVNGFDSKIVTDINAQFDKLSRYVSYLAHTIIDPLLSVEAQDFNLAWVFNFLNRKSYGEDPSSYLSLMRDGKLISNQSDKDSMAAPEIKEILLAAPVIVGTIDYWSRRTTSIAKRAKELLRYNNGPATMLKPLNYELPSEIKEIRQSFQTQSELAILNSWSEALTRFEQNDINANNTLRATSDQYLEFKARVDAYLGYMASIANKLVPESTLAWNLNNFLSYLTMNFERASVQAGTSWTGFASLNKIADFIKQSVDVVKGFLKESASVLIEFFDGVNKATLELFEPSRLFNSLSFSSKALGSVGLALEVINFLVEIIGHVVTDTYHYDYNHGEVHYYWNGGSHRKHSVFGFEFESEVKAMTNDSLIVPVSIQRPTQSGGYYYRNRILGSETELRQAFVRDLKNNVFPSLVKKKLTLIESNGENRTLEQPDVENAILVFRFIMWFGISFFHQVSITPLGFIIDLEIAKDVAISQLLEKLKPITVVQLPELKESGELEKLDFVLPASSANPLWSLPEEGFDYYSSILQRKHVILDPNIEFSYSTFLGRKRAIDLAFKALFNLTFKDTLKRNLLNTRRYNLLPIMLNAIDNESGSHLASYGLQNLIKVKTPIGKIAFFSNSGAALGWVLVELGLQVSESKKVVNALRINTRIYALFEEFIAYVLARQADDEGVGNETI